MTDDLVETNAEQTVYGSKRAFNPRANSLGEGRKNQGHQDGDKCSQHYRKSNPRHLNSMNDLVDLKLSVRKGWNLSCH